MRTSPPTDGGEEDAEEEVEAAEDRRQASLSASLDAGCALDVGGDRGCAHEGASGRHKAVHDEGGVLPLEVAVLIHESGILGHGEERSGGVLRE